MKRTRMILMLICLLVSSGCVNQPNPKGDLLLAQNSFLRAVNSLTILREAGKFSEDDIARIKVAVISGDKFLDQWTEAVLEGKEFPDAIGLFENILQELIKYRRAGEENGR